MEIRLTFSPAAKQVVSQHPEVRGFDSTSFAPQKGDTVALMLCDPDQREEFVCTGRQWDLAQPGGEPILFVALDLVR